ncbi:P-loop containing nucleoside triphosphate hydrolase protein [Scenedesmus sp. NREL 46B-D3]|nr:P-loop containing nucleoside triphosphate hydrolase protein [Scenedesmus sp. NREL 46B-D3]
MPGQRAGLVGANGAGKSTLLKAIAGLRGVDSGKLLIANNVSLGYLAQTAVSGSTRTVYDEVRNAMQQLVAAEAAMVAAAAGFEAGDPDAPQKLADAQADFEAAGGYDVDRRIGTVLDGLGFTREQWDWGCDRFSGGWQMRIALACMLLSPAGQAATGSGGGGGSAGVRGRRLHHYVGGYSKFLLQREERATLAAATAATQAAEIKRLEDFVARLAPKRARLLKRRANLRWALLEKLKKEAAATAEPLSAASGSGPGDARKVMLRFPAPPACYTDVLSVKGLAVGWGAAPGSTAAPQQQQQVQDVNFTVQKGQRVLVLGPNGAGKSTLMKTLSGRLQPWSGSVSQGQGVKLGIFDQDLAQELPLDETALDYVSDVARKTDPSLTLEKVRAALGALGLTGSLPLQQIGSLSGGEKARASNHLDAATLEVLTGALKNFTGAVVAITHNQAFATALQPTHVLRGKGRAPAAAAAPAPAAQNSNGKKSSSSSNGGSSSNGSSSAVSSKGSSSTTSSSSSKPARKRTTLSYSERIQYEKLCKDLDELNKQRATLEARVSQLAQVGGDLAALEAASSQLAAVADKADAAELQWLELAELAGDL